VASARWIGYLLKLAALAAAVLIGPDGAEAQLAGGSGFDAAALFVLTPLASAATETSEERAESTVDPAPRPRVRRALVAPVRPRTFPVGSLNELFNRGGLLGGFAAGFLGCGVFGLLFGRGLFGGLSGAPSYFGLFVQLGILATLCWLIWTRWRDDDAADVAALSPRQLADPYLRSLDDLRAPFDAPPDQAAGDPHDQSSGLRGGESLNCE
jgi:predicted lipid-binding transport protein (Tim44 family)